MIHITSAITTFYKVSVIFPSDAWDEIFRRRLNEKYEIEMCEATNGCAHSGESSYAERYDWAEYYTYEEAKKAKARMLAVAAKYAALLQQERPE